MSARALVLSALLASGPARAQEAPRPVTFEEAVAAAARTPALRAWQHELVAAEAQVDAAGAWPSPTLNVQTNRLTARIVAGASIPLPVLGAVGAARRAARANADVVRADAGVAARELRYRAAAAWLALGRADAQVAATAIARQQAADLAAIAQGRLDAGVGADVDVTIARAATARADLAAQVAVRAQHVAAAELAGLLAWDPAQPLASAGPVPLAGDVPPLARLREGVKLHPAYAAATRRVTAADAGVAVARVQRRPGFAVESQVSAHDPTTPGTDVLVGVSIELPLFAKVGAKVRAEQARAAAARAELDARAIELDAALVAAYERLASATETLTALERDIVPAQERASALAAQAHREGARDLATALQASRDLAAVRAEVAAARTDAAAAWLELQDAAGADLARDDAR